MLDADYNAYNMSILILQRNSYTWFYQMYTKLLCQKVQAPSKTGNALPNWTNHPLFKDNC